MAVDSFRWLPRSMVAGYQSREMVRQEPIPWTPLAKPLSRCRIGLVTTAGVYVKGLEPPFDIEREKREPTWGDPTFRRIPAGTAQEQIGATHLHINTRDILEDVNVALPIHRLQELAEEGVIGSVASDHYSFMGWQQRGLVEWRTRYAPEVAALFRKDGVDAVVLAPA